MIGVGFSFLFTLFIPRFNKTLPSEIPSFPLLQFVNIVFPRSWISNEMASLVVTCQDFDLFSVSTPHRQKPSRSDHSLYCDFPPSQRHNTSKVIKMLTLTLKAELEG
jgi:hypothetical protein